MRYVPSPVPHNAPPTLKAWLADELRRISADMLSHTPDVIRLQPAGAAPARPTDGMIVYAVAPWATDDLLGEGFYGREQGAWIKL